ncbi:MAG: hypothetical protein FWF56_06485 [Firmicutes bacterium]|nr:hypothetical protein [Bacillota bacterium]MCL1953199.1 hypothetical protein [Bacillota bacterium]
MTTTIKDIVYMAAILGQLDDVVALIEQDTGLKTQDGKVVSSDENVDKGALEVLNLLVRCANLVYSEIATEYASLVATELLTVDGEVLEYRKFGRSVLEILSVSCKGRRTKFKLRPDGLILDNGRYSIEYRYLPDKCNFEQEIEYKAGAINARILAFGTITEYCIISGLQDDAVMWDGRYRQSLFGIVLKGEKKIKPMRWL